MALDSNAVLFSGISDVLKEVWTTEEIERQLKFKTKILDYIGKGKGINETGRYAIVPIETRGNVQSVARSEGEALGTPGKTTEKQAKYNFKSLYISFQLSGQAIASTSSNQQAILNEVVRQPKVAVRDFGYDVGRQIYGNVSGSGILAKCGTTSSSTTVVLDVRQGWSAIRSGAIIEDRIVDIGTTGDADSVAAGRTISTVTRSSTAPTIVISGAAVTTTSSHYVSIAGNRSASDGSSKELTSLNQICAATGTVGQLATSSVPEWFGTYQGNSGTTRSCSLDLLLTAYNNSAIYGGSPNLVATNPFVRQKYYTGVFQPTVQMVDPTNSTSAQFHSQNSVHFEGMPVIADNQCPASQLFMLSTENLKFYGPWDKGIDWMPGVNGILNRVTGYDGYQADAFYYTELGTNNRAAQVLVDDIAE